MTPAGHDPRPEDFLVPGGVFIPADTAPIILFGLLPVVRDQLDALAANLPPSARAALQALASARDAPPPPPESGPWVPVDVAAADVGCTPRRVRQLIAAGDVDAHRHGARAWSVDLASLRAHYRRPAPQAA